MKRTIAIASLVAVAGFATTGWAASPKLKGSYAFTGEASCLVSPGHWNDSTALPTNPNPNNLLPGAGFNARLQPNDIVQFNNDGSVVLGMNGQPLSNPGNNQSSFTRSFSVFGVRTFNGDGTGHVKGTAVGIDGRPTPGPTGWPHFPPSAGSADFEYDFTYTLDDNGGFIATAITPYTETFTSGPRFTPVQQTARVDAIPPFTGSISLDGKTLIAAHTPFPVIEQRTFSNGDVWPEICHRSRIFMQLQP